MDIGGSWSPINKSLYAYVSTQARGEKANSNRRKLMKRREGEKWWCHIASCGRKLHVRSSLAIVSRMKTQRNARHLVDAATRVVIPTTRKSPPTLSSKTSFFYGRLDVKRSIYLEEFWRNLSEKNFKFSKQCKFQLRPTLIRSSIYLQHLQIVCEITILFVTYVNHWK